MVNLYQGRTAFLSQYSNLTLEQLDDKEDEIKFNNQQPMIDFENQYGFTNSLRKRYNTENDIYLSTSVLDESKNPNITLAFSNGELSLVNDKQQVMIGTVIYNYTSDGYISISQNYATVLALIDQNDPSVGSQSGVVVVANTSGAECDGWRSAGSPYGYTNGRFAQRVAKIRSAPFYTKTEKMTIHYKRKNNKWKESRASMAVSILQQLKDNNCGG